MEKHETAPRRVGTFTLGAVLVVSGLWMMVTMFFPSFDLVWVLKGSPIILIILGIETLLAARGGGKVRYDWVGMILCFILVCAALCLYAIACWMVWNPAWEWRF
ncbi:MAG: hypothetical protein PUC45_02950 [Oscillospiraceae bacterium]|nr:hypothetical protein [Oscillospiraceae bacterium]